MRIGFGGRGNTAKFFSQHGEDKAIRHLFPTGYKGYFVEVGALDGIGRSNTYYFYRLRWHGINIEPHLQYFRQLVRNRPRDKNLNVAVWHEDAETSDFYATKDGTWSRVGSHPSPEILKRLGHTGYYARARKRGIQLQHPKLRTLDRILKENKAPMYFDILSIDVENSERHVLKGFTLERYMPRIVIIEDLIGCGFSEFFGPCSYTSVKRRGQQNIIYCREIADARTVKKNWV